MPVTRRAPSIRALVIVILVVAALHVAAIWAYLALGVTRGAAALVGETTPVLQVFEDLHHRADAMQGAVRLTVAPLPTDSAGRFARAAETRRRMAEVGGPTAALPFATVPPSMRVPLARASDELSRLQNILQEFAALLELGRVTDAARRHAQADSLMDRLHVYFGEAQEAGLRDLLSREGELSATASRAVVVLGWWFATGVMLLAIVFWLIRERVHRPLGEMEAGLRQVAAGELSTRLPVHRTDEMGRLATVFNQTTGVLRERAEQQGRYAAAGELMAGVAHEVNNPLMAIASLAELRLADPGLSPELRDDLDQVRAQARRAAKLLSGLLRFVRPSEGERTDVDLNGALGHALDLLSYRLPVEGVEVERVLAAALPAVRCDPTRMEQVFVNLVSNALDALRAIEPPKRLLVRTWAAGDRVYAAVSDNGPGVPDHVRERLFVPFVSGKDEGSGLGLYMSRQIVREADGELVYQPGGDGGALFVIRLPAVERPVAAPDRRPTPATGVPRPMPLAGLAVLVVDDEDSIRRVIGLYLERRGASVVAARDGSEALRRLEDATPDLILADLRMPIMSGTELYRALERDRPELVGRVVFLSGDLTQLAELGQNHGVPPERILAKPIDLAELERRILGVTGGEGRSDGERLATGPSTR
jgi:signal transduction histidine kinase/CheY-like chemotaxis protein